MPSNILDPVRNLAIVNVSTTYDASAVTVVLSAGQGALLPDPSTEGAFNLTWFNASDYVNPASDPKVELVRCTARSTDTLTIVRAQEGTSASTKNNVAVTYRMIVTPTKKTRDDIETVLQGIAQTGTAGETLAVNDWVYRKTSDSKLYKGDYTTIEKATYIGVISAGGATNDVVRYIPTGNKWVTTGLTAGAEYYASATAGQVTTTVPVFNSGSVVPVKIGFASSTTELDIQIQRLQRRVSQNYTLAQSSSSQTVTVGFPISHAIQTGGQDTNGPTAGTIYEKHKRTEGWFDAVTNTQGEYGRAATIFLFVPAAAGATGGQGAEYAASVNGSNDLVLTKGTESGGSGQAIGIITVWERL